MVGSVFRRTPALVQRVILDHGASSVSRLTASLLENEKWKHLSCVFGKS